MIAALSIYNCTYIPPATERTRLDGDTFRCTGDVRPIAPDVTQWIPKVRVVRYDAPETGDPGAEEARTALIQWLQASPFNLICYGRDKYGRLLADAERGTGLLSTHMLDAGLVEPMTFTQAMALVDDPDLVVAIAHPAHR